MLRAFVRSAPSFARAARAHSTKAARFALLSPHALPIVRRTAVSATVVGSQPLLRQINFYSTEAALKDEEPKETLIEETEVVTAINFMVEIQARNSTMSSKPKQRSFCISSQTHCILRRSELISNAADALEKLRHMQLIEQGFEATHPLEIHISVDKEKRTFIIQDFGIGMTEEELNQNLGTIAQSGSKAFLENLEKEGGSSMSKDKIIGQFGVGFYSTVYSRSARPGSKGYCWTTDGLGSYTLAEAEGVAVGTKIVIELREDSANFASKFTIDSVIKKYSNFVGFPIHLNGTKVNTVEPLWTQDKSAVTTDQHREFYRFVANAWDDPQFTLHYRTDAPMSIRSILYVPEHLLSNELLGQRLEPGVSLYSRKVLIQPKSKALLPEWLRFVKGVVDLEDLPLNVSRELLQDNVLSKLRNIMTARIIRWFHNESHQNPDKFNKFFLDFGQFLKEGICIDAQSKKDIAKLLRYETSATKEGELIGLKEYVERKKEGQERIYYLLTPKRKFAEESPYLEAFRKKDIEVLYLYDTVDEFVVDHLREHQRMQLVSIDSNEAATDPLLYDTEASDSASATALTDQQAKELADWIQQTLGPQVVKQVDISRRLVSYPAIITDRESPAMQRMLAMMSGSARLEAPPPMPNKLEINPDHLVMRGLFTARNDKPELAKMVVEQVYDNALCAAGVLGDPRSMISRLNTLLEISLGQAVEQDKKIPINEEKN
ncbi:Hsp90 protein-domain-containing protein [Jimgerdemannia flammicorona]|uniref:Hsp90 protein-domain-containing protein n=1 Tax=Jimgerdemannia flammicorona TaxID=994334 RepID=A0A433QPP2_9FUNG|nr:Hsp90 protein-domain-containing protein [Jimgerdemannia flammicorona]